jgi:hypothetical protein
MIDQPARLEVTGAHGPGDQRWHNWVVDPLKKHDTLRLTSVLHAPITAIPTPARGHAGLQSYVG